MIIIGTLLVLIALCVGICLGAPKYDRFIPNRKINAHRVTPRFHNE